MNVTNEAVVFLDIHERRMRWRNNLSNDRPNKRDSWTDNPRDSWRDNSMGNINANLRRRSMMWCS
jgi:hypothetical protein